MTDTSFYHTMQAVFLKKSTILINPASKRSGSGPICAGPPKKQAKLSAFFKKGLPEPVVSEEELSQEAVGVPAGHVSVVEQVSYDFEDEGKRFNGEGRTITIEFSNFILVACYVPNSGEDLKRLNYRVEEW